METLKDGKEWIRDAKRVRGAPNWCLRAVMKARSMVMNWRYQFVFRLLSRPGHLRVIRCVTNFLRRVQPLAKVGNLVLTTTHPDTCEVLDSVGRFNAADELTLRMPVGEFVLGIDWPRRHEHERRLIKEARMGDPSDEQRLRAIVTRGFDRALQHPADRHMNVAHDLTEDICLDVAVEYFGVGYKADREELRIIFRLLASRVFQAPPPGSCAEIRTRLASDRLMSIITSSQSTPPSANWTSQTILQRLESLPKPLPKLRPQRDEFDRADFWDLWAQRNAASLAVFGTATMPRAITQAAYQLLTLPGAAGEVKLAAKPYASTASSAPLPKQRRQVLAIIYEALRFNPMLPILATRTAVRASVLAAGTARRTPIHAGCPVLPLTYAAMFDPSVFPKPNRFEPGQATMDKYLHFGFGPHACAGQRVAEIIMEETIGRLFALPNIRASERKGGRVIYDGPAVEEFWVRWS